MSKEEKKVNRRDFLFTASYTVGAVGIGAVIWPMIDQMNPDKAQQALATTEVDISNIEPGKSITVLWSCLLYTSPSPRDRSSSRMPSSA